MPRFHSWLLGVGLVFTARATTAWDRRLATLPVAIAGILAAFVGSQYLIGVDIGG